MKLFLDSANIKEIELWLKTGLIDGITTNPTLLGKQANNPKQTIRKICSLAKEKPVSIEVTEYEPEKVYKQAVAIAHIAPNVVVKIPCDKQYLDIITRLVVDGISVNVTLVFTLFQGLSMCKINAAYISPFVGRLDGIDGCGSKLIKELAIMVDTYKFNTKVLAASLRNVKQLHDVINAGADCATLPVELLDKAIEHPLTEVGINKFLHDWKQLGVKIFP